MFDIGWMELMLIGIVALIVVGPKDLPKLFRSVGQFMGKARGMAREFQRSMEQAADESGLRDAARDLNSVNDLNLKTPGKAARTYAERVAKGAKPSSADPASPVQDGGMSSADAAPPRVRPKAAAASDVASDKPGP